MLKRGQIQTQRKPVKLRELTNFYLKMAIFGQLCLHFKLEEKIFGKSLNILAIRGPKGLFK
jgi:hypothetical protein